MPLSLLSSLSSWIISSVFIGKITVDDGKVIASMSNVEHIACTDSVTFYDWHEALLNIVGLSDRVLNGRIDLTSKLSGWQKAQLFDSPLERSVRTHYLIAGGCPPRRS